MTFMSKEDFAAAFPVAAKGEPDSPEETPPHADSPELTAVDYRAIVRKYRARHRRQDLLKQILWTAYWAVLFSAAFIWILRAIGWL